MKFEDLFLRNGDYAPLTELTIIAIDGSRKVMFVQDVLEIYGEEKVLWFNLKNVVLDVEELI